MHKGGGGVLQNENVIKHNRYGYGYPGVRRRIPYRLRSRTHICGRKRNRYGLILKIVVRKRNRYGLIFKIVVRKRNRYGLILKIVVRKRNRYGLILKVVVRKRNRYGSI